MTTPRDRVYADVPGLYAVRMAKNAVEIAVKVEREQPLDLYTEERLSLQFYWIITINGRLAHNSADVYPRLLIGRRIDAKEYAFLLADREWARQHAPGSPEANPFQPIDLDTVPIPF